MINEVLAAIHHLLPERLFILLPNRTEPELVIYSDDYKAVIRTDDHLPVYVVMSRETGKLMTWGEGMNVMDAVRQSVDILNRQSHLQKAA